MDRSLKIPGNSRDVNARPVTSDRSIRILNRRDLTLGAGASVLMAALLSTAGRAKAGEAGEAAATTIVDPARTAQYEEALQAVLKGATASEGQFQIELPDLAENGNVVPYTLAFDSPMTDEDYIKTMHLLSTSNPQAHVATFHLIPATGKATVSGRMRLARSQDVVAIAEHSSGAFHLAVRKVEVTIGGCGAE